MDGKERTVSLREIVRSGILLAIFGLLLSEASGVFLLFAFQGFRFSPSRILGVHYALALGLIIALRGWVLLAYGRWAFERGIWDYSWKIEKRGAGLILGIVLFAAAWKIGFVPARVHPLQEFFHLFQKYGPVWGLLNSALQFVYYILEGFLILFLLDAFQRAGELKFGTKAFPWGGIGLILFWASLHFLKGLSTGFYAAFLSILFGISYIIDRRNASTIILSWLATVLF